MCFQPDSNISFLWVALQQQHAAGMEWLNLLTWILLIGIAGIYFLAGGKMRKGGVASVEEERVLRLLKTMLPASWAEGIVSGDQGDLGGSVRARTGNDHMSRGLHKALTEDAA